MVCYLERIEPHRPHICYDHSELNHNLLTGISFSGMLLSIFDSLIARISKVYFSRGTRISSMCLSKLLTFKLAIFNPLDFAMACNEWSSFSVPGFGK